MQRALDFFIRASLWLMAPLYIGLLGAMLLVILEFIRELVVALAQFPNTDAASAIVDVLRLINLVLVGHLVFIMSMAGILTLRSVTGGAESGAAFWANQADWGSLKVRVVSAMVAIGAVDLLEVLLGAQRNVTSEDIFWKIMILATFVLAGLLLVVADWIAAGNQANSNEV
jgi:uncharacterized protein (TIGR00645 family)